ncbi:unnamed protein product, partial [Ectocarpus sp. 8 AP-2014]
GFEPDLELEGRDDSEEDFNTNKDDDGSGGGASGNISGRYAPSSRTGAGGNGSIISFSPAFSPSPIRGPHGGGGGGGGEAWRDPRACCNDSDDWAIGGGLDEGLEMAD